MKGIASMYSACRDIFRSRVRNARVRIFFFSDKIDGKGENITSCVKIDRTFEQARLLLSNDERGYERRTCTWKSMTPTIQIRGCKTTSICQYDSLSLFLDTRRRGLDRNSCHSNRYFAVSFRIYSLSLSPIINTITAEGRNNTRDDTRGCLSTCARSKGKVLTYGVLAVARQWRFLAYA